MANLRSLCKFLAGAFCSLWTWFVVYGILFFCLSTAFELPSTKPLQDRPYLFSKLKRFLGRCFPLTPFRCLLIYSILDLFSFWRAQQSLTCGLLIFLLSLWIYSKMSIWFVLAPGRLNEIGGSGIVRDLDDLCLIQVLLICVTCRCEWPFFCASAYLVQFIFVAWYPYARLSAIHIAIEVANTRASIRTTYYNGHSRNIVRIHFYCYCFHRFFFAYRQMRFSRIRSKFDWNSAIYSNRFLLLHIHFRRLLMTVDVLFHLRELCERVAFIKKKRRQNLPNKSILEWEKTLASEWL